MQTQENLIPYLSESSNIDFKSGTFIDFMEKANLSGTPKEKALQWYLFVRDAFLYDPYHLDLRSKSLTVSHVVSKKRAWCVEKSLVFVAGCRAMQIPARLGFGIVQNHLGADQLALYLKRKEIVFHGYAEVFLNGKWVKCTPAFDRRICAISKIEPLNWNGEEDSLFQAFSGDHKFMEYLHFYGEFAEIPFKLMYSEMEKHYPHLFSNPINTKAFSFQF